MQVVILCLLVAVVASSVEAFPQQLLQGDLQPKRGFRVGAGDRFSHGFGKRLVDLDDGLTIDGDEAGLRLDILVDHLVNNPELLRAILQRYFDRNNDGIIERKELFRSD